MASFLLDQHTYNETTYRMDHHTQYFLHQRMMGGQYTDFGRCHRYHIYAPVQVAYWASLAYKIFETVSRLSKFVYHVFFYSHKMFMRAHKLSCCSPQKSCSGPQFSRSFTH